MCMRLIWITPPPPARKWYIAHQSVRSFFWDGHPRENLVLQLSWNYGRRTHQKLPVSCHMVDCCCACITTASEVPLVVSIWATAIAQKGHMVVFVREVRAAGCGFWFVFSLLEKFHSVISLLEKLTPRNSLLENFEEWATPLIDSSKTLSHSSKKKMCRSHSSKSRWRLLETP